MSGNIDGVIRLFWSNEQIERLICTLCYYLLIAPMQLMCCGVRTCESCFKSRLQQLTQCPFCLAPGAPEVRLDKGYARELERLKVNCPRCNEQWFGHFKDLPGHLINHCNLQCENCEEKFVFPQQLVKHERDDCQNRVIPCPLAFLGCSTKIPHDKIGEHYLSNKHQRCLLKFVKEFFPQVSQRRLKGALRKTSDENYQSKLVEYSQKMELLIQEVSSMIDNCTHMDSEREAMVTKINEIRTEATKLKESSDNNTKLLESLQQILLLMQQAIDNIKSKPMGGPQLISADGTFIWKVNLTLLLNSGQPIKSDPIHSSQSGYKLMITCDIYFDAPKQKRYVSISVTVLKGEFDAILFWPIAFPITLSIMDFTATKKHISRIISYDSQPTASQRPISDANTPFRILQFCELDTLVENANNYMQDGHIFIQLGMDFTAPGANVIPNKALTKPIEDPIQRNILQNVS